MLRLRGGRIRPHSNIDKLASQGFNFREAIFNTPVCAPYRASLITPLSPQLMMAPAMQDLRRLQNLPG
jgi:arylsulfatase A-like enzyme